jgi:prepilin-type N-terminal cleavage/methylation domain-containing protein
MQSPRVPTTSRGFTLIELLIVIAIILILISIALPNFLEAQERARITKAKTMLRTLETAINGHIIDFGFVYSDFNDEYLITSITRNKRKYQEEPCGVFNAPVSRSSSLNFDQVDPANWYAPNMHCPLSTPIKYIDGHDMQDPWGDGSVPVGMDSRELGPRDLPDRILSPENGSTLIYAAYFVCGPDRVCGDWTTNSAYNPTNGTKSVGDLWMVISTVSTKYTKRFYNPLKTF